MGSPGTDATAKGYRNWPPVGVTAPFGPMVWPGQYTGSPLGVPATTGVAGTGSPAWRSGAAWRALAEGTSP